VDGRPIRESQGVILWSSRCMSMKRTSVFAGTCLPSRGGSGIEDLNDRTSRLRSAHQAWAETRERVRLSWQCSRDERGARKLVLGGDSPAQTTRRTFARTGPVCPGHAFSEGCLVRLVSPYHPREGVDEGEGAERSVTSLRRTRNRSSSRSVPVRRRIAEVGRAPSGS